MARRAATPLLTEEASFNPVTPYGKSKVLAEQDLKALADDRFCPVLMRSATAYGVSPRIRFDLVLNNLTAWAVTAGRILIKSDGTPWRPVVHAEDISRAFVAALEAPDDAGTRAGVQRRPDRPRTIASASLRRSCARPCRAVRSEYAPDASPDTRNYRVNCDKIARVLPTFRPHGPRGAARSSCIEAFVSQAL